MTESAVDLEVDQPGGNKEPIGPNRHISSIWFSLDNQPAGDYIRLLESVPDEIGARLESPGYRSYL